MKPMICSFQRSGTHYLASLLHRNLDTGADNYEQLHYSHSAVPNGPYIHVWRPILPVMLSVWRLREHFGAAESVSFSEMLRVPWSALPRSPVGAAYINGERDDRVCPPKWGDERLPAVYARTVRMFASRAALNLRYEDCAADPLRTVERAATVFALLRWEQFSLVQERVGWWPAEERAPDVTREDLVLLTGFSVDP